jgi:hypothetical protein
MATRPTPLVVKQILSRHNAIREGAYVVPPHVLGQISAALLQALRDEHYAPNPRDLVSSVALVKAIIEWEVNSGNKDLPEAAAYTPSAPRSLPSLMAMGHTVAPSPARLATPTGLRPQPVPGQAIDAAGRPVTDNLGRPLDAAGRLV